MSKGCIGCFPNTNTEGVEERTIEGKPYFLCKPHADLLDKEGPGALMVSSADALLDGCEHIGYTGLEDDE